MLEFYLIRHAESSKVPGSITGRSPSSLMTVRGKLEARALRMRLQHEGVRFAQVFSSPLQRAYMTAQDACVPIYPLERIILADELMERSFGEWEDKPEEEVYTDDVWESIVRNPLYHAPPGGESHHDVMVRAYGFIEKILPQYETGVMKRFGIFTHTNVIRNILCRVMEYSPAMIDRVEIGNTSITEIAYNAYSSVSGWHLRRVNDAAHLLHI